MSHDFLHVRKTAAESAKEASDQAQARLVAEQVIEGLEHRAAQQRVQVYDHRREKLREQLNDRSLSFTRRFRIADELRFDTKR